MNTLNLQHRIPGVHLGTVIEAGNLDDDSPDGSGMLVKMPVAQIIGGRNIVYQPVAVISADELILGEITGFDADANTITLQLEDVRAANPVIGQKLVVRVNKTGA